MECEQFHLCLYAVSPYFDKGGINTIDGGTGH
jgi:hypothetical protein